MATLRVTANDIFPTGMLIGAYAANGRFSLPTDAAPSGSPVATATMVDGGVLLTGLDDNVTYFVGGNVGGGVYRYVRISTALDASTGSGGGSGSGGGIDPTAGGQVAHGTNAAANRPAHDSVTWIGSVQPANLRAGDVWIRTA